MESLLQASINQLAYVQGQKSTSQGEKEALQWELDDKLRRLRELDEQKKTSSSTSSMEQQKLKDNHLSELEIKDQRIHSLQNQIADAKEAVSEKRFQASQT